MVKTEYSGYEKARKRNGFEKAYLANKYGEGDDYAPSKVMFNLTFEDGSTEAYDAHDDICRLKKKERVSEKMAREFANEVENENFYFSETNHRFENMYVQINLNLT